MHYSQFIAIGFVSLGCTITAIPFNGKPQIAKRVGSTVTATFGGCTAVCWDATSAIECDEVQCEQLQTAAPTPNPILKDRAAITSASQGPMMTVLMPIGPVSANQTCGKLCGSRGCVVFCEISAQLPGSLFRSLLCQA